MKDALTQLFSDLLAEQHITTIVPQVTRSENPSHGEYTTNIAMATAKSLKQNPLDIARDIKKTLEEWMKSDEKKKVHPIILAIDHIDVAPPGFINVFLTDEALLQCDSCFKPESSRCRIKPACRQAGPGMIEKTGQKKKKIMVEYAQPNTHKAFHIGHLRNITTGESIVRLLEANGNKVIRVNYQGDVGLHIAKCLYGILQSSKFRVQSSDKKTLKQKIDMLAQAYVMGNTAYEKDEAAKKEIDSINKKIYRKEPDIYPLYEKTRNWSLEYFESIYKRLGTHFDRLYFESEVYELGKQLVLEGMEKGIFEKSDGAIIFPGEKFGLHNRVFITSEGNPTYEGKDIGLSKLQFGDYHPERIIHCVSTEQIEYFKVIFEAIARVFSDTRGKEYHLPYGFVQLKSGKMSSRTGNVVLGEWLLDETKKEIQKILKTGGRAYEKGENDTIAEIASVAAVKYAFLKVSTTQKIAFDIKESINLNGDSGPYLLYTYARCQSVMRKNNVRHQISNVSHHILNKEEHDLVRLLFYFPEIIEDAGKHFAPNTLCSYLFNLAQAFNLLYAKHPILGNDLRLMLTEKTATTLKEGLRLLGIETVERM